LRHALRRLDYVGSLTALCILIAACGDGSDDTQQTAAVAPPPSSVTDAPPGTTNPPSSSANSAPTISGAPLNSVLQGQSYSFRPTARDADGNALTFSVSGAPAWLQLDATTGRLSGAPTAADIGVYTNIVVTVSDGTASSSLKAFSLSVVATATGSVTLSWTPPTSHTDGSPLTDLAGYKVYWGTQQGEYPNTVTLNNPGLTSYTIDQLTAATWYFVTTAFDKAGVESAYSGVASKTLQ
jgi:hypothetical protein